jgi:hypothetical protein
MVEMMKRILSLLSYVFFPAVTKFVPPGVVVAGNPARIIGDYDKLERKRLKTFISDKDMAWSLNYKERMSKVIQPFKPYMEK